MPSRSAAVRARARPSSASANSCETFQCRPSGSHTGRLAKRRTTSSTTVVPSTRPVTTRPDSAPRSTAANTRALATIARLRSQPPAAGRLAKPLYERGDVRNQHAEDQQATRDDLEVVFVERARQQQRAAK